MSWFRKFGASWPAVVDWINCLRKAVTIYVVCDLKNDFV